MSLDFHGPVCCKVVRCGVVVWTVEWPSEYLTLTLYVVLLLPAHPDLYRSGMLRGSERWGKLSELLNRFGIYMFFLFIYSFLVEQTGCLHFFLLLPLLFNCLFIQFDWHSFWFASELYL